MTAQSFWVATSWQHLPPPDGLTGGLRRQETPYSTKSAAILTVFATLQENIERLGHTENSRA